MGAPGGVGYREGRSYGRGWPVRGVKPGCSAPTRVQFAKQLGQPALRQVGRGRRQGAPAGKFRPRGLARSFHSVSLRTRAYGGACSCNSHSWACTVTSPSRLQPPLLGPWVHPTPGPKASHLAYSMPPICDPAVGNFPPFEIRCRRLRNRSQLAPYRFTGNQPPAHWFVAKGES